MFTKRVKCIRDLDDEYRRIDKKITREVSKLNQNIQAEIKKVFRNILPGLSVKIEKLEIEDFFCNRKNKKPLTIFLENLNDKIIHKDGCWVIEDEEGYCLSDNRITVEQFQKICNNLSEEFGILVKMNEIQEDYHY